MWGGWKTDASDLTRAAYRLGKMENRFTLQGNAVERAVGAMGKYYIVKASEDQKIDLAMSSVLAHAATLDAIASGAANVPDDTIYTGSSTSRRAYTRR